MSPDPNEATWLALELPSYLFGPTCPEVPDEFRGIRIAAPKRLRAGSALRIPVSAVSRFAEESASLPQPLWDSVMAVVVEVESNRCWVGSLRNPYESPEEMPADDEDSGADDSGAATEPSEDEDIPEFKSTGAAANECAHVDLRELLELPATPGSYEIHLTYGTWSSNTVRVEVERE